MRRTQLYLEEDLWQTLHVKARQTGLTVSELVRRAVREQYADRKTTRKQAMLGWIGVWKDRADIGDTETYVRRLRKDTRLERLAR